ncbi:MAG TPA: tetratricopeptide repeat protein [Gemmataceae bacterium]|nr:tetratricopeptide repeat protein [Gemmataceae bacterium]
MQIDFASAVEHHVNGRLDEAAKIYRAILACQPRHADALHLLGLVAHQQGDHLQACQLIGKAIAVEPGVASYYSDLAEAYRATGHLEQALGCCQAALVLQPDSVEASNNLGLTLLAQGNTAEAIPHFQAALRHGPGVAMIHNNLGNALRLQGDAQAAINSFRAAVQLDQGLAEAHSNLGQLLLERYEREQAIFHCREAVRLRPDLPEAHNNLGNVLRDSGELAEAKSCYAEALRLNPDLALSYGNMGQALQEEGNLPEAIAWYERALQRDPRSPRINCNLASAYEEREDFQGAVALYRAALELDPQYAEAHNGLGYVLHELGKFPEAVAEYREVLRLKPDFATGYCNLGNILEELGSFDEALAAFRAALRRDPDHAGAYSLLATMLRGRLPAEDLQAIQRLLARPQMALAKRLALHFGIAHVLDGMGSYAEAAEHLQEGNALCSKLWKKQGKSYDPQAHTEQVNSLIGAFTPEFFARVRGFGLATELPVFIVGLPRSGTTLTEQILASHSQVHGAGELNCAREGFETLPAMTVGAATAIEGLACVGRSAVQQLSHWHLARLQELAPKANRVVDKMPDNYLFLGWLYTLFPQAKFIHCRRDLRDVAVSCWMTNFRNIRWAADRDHIAARFQDYLRLMAHWRALLPASLLEVDYEETVANLETVARRVVAWCGLEWEASCLAFHQTSRPIRTASVTQVREPVYTRSVARWKNYESTLGQLFERLRPTPDGQ